jgi:hypothetical protein
MRGAITPHRKTARPLVAGLALAMAGVLGTADAWAQSSETAQLKAQLARMQEQMQAQQAAMDQMRRRIDELESSEASRVQSVPAATPAVAAPAATGAAVAAQVPAVEAPSRISQPPSAMAGVQEPAPEGYIPLGDSGNFLKLDVVAQVDMMVDDKFMGYEDLFIPASIPVTGAAFHDSDTRSTLSGKQSVVRMDFMRNTPYGVMKVVYKNNFFGFGGPDMDYNLQYLYGQLENKNYSVLAGYYLSGFTDISVFPNTLDYEGPNSFTFKYAPQIRYTPVLYRQGEARLTLPMSLEKPNADIAVIGDYEPYSRWPDVTLGLRWETPDWHIQWANVFRDLATQSATDDTTRTTEAYATQLTFAAGVFEDDSVQGWVSTGKGYANFLQDITGFGLDAAFSPGLQLEAIDVEGYGLGYTHTWRAGLTSSASYGYLKIDPDDDLLIDPSLPESTNYASLNLAWQFSDRAMLGGELLWGRLEDLAGESGEAKRVQVSFRYDLNP